MHHTRQQESWTFHRLCDLPGLTIPRSGGRIVTDLRMFPSHALIQIVDLFAAMYILLQGLATVLRGVRFTVSVQFVVHKTKNIQRHPDSTGIIDDLSNTQSLFSAGNSASSQFRALSQRYIMSLAYIPHRLIHE